MASFILRDIDPDFWRKVKAKAALEGVTVKAAILALLEAWVTRAGGRDSGSSGLGGR